MQKALRMKKTKQIVYEVGRVDSNHKLILFPFKQKSKKGDLGVCQIVRNDNLIDEQQSPRFADQ